MNLRNKTTSEFRTVFGSTMGVPNSQVSLYLKQLLPTLINQCTRYSLRGGDNFSIPHTRKSYIKNSFFWSGLDDWNKLDLDIRESNIHTLFKTKLHQQLCKPLMLSKLYNKTSGKASVYHTRMRMGLSGLNAHRRITL